MFGHGKADFHVTPEQEQLLQSRTFSLRPLSTAGHLSVSRLLGLTWQPIAIFIFTVLVLTSTELRYRSPVADQAVLFCGLVALLIFPVIGFMLLLFGVIVARIHSPVRWSAVLYWMYWPFWKLVLCVLAVAVAANIGNALWYSNFYPHERYQQLQAYSAINPEITSGVRLMDAGIVQFDVSAGVDRSRTACLKNGATYCIAPMVKNGTVPVSTEAKPFDDTVYDLFVVGVDCCGCPGEFRCGDWNVPGAAGGLRVLSEDAVKLYTLASQNWATSYEKKTENPVFFELTSDPIRSYKGMASRGFRVVVLALMLFPAVTVLVAMLLNSVLLCLCDAGIATTLSAPLPQGRVGRMLSARFLPDVYNNQQNLRLQQQAGLGDDAKYVIL